MASNKIINDDDDDFISLYPTRFRDRNYNYIKLENRRKKLNKIFNNINNENII